jgi:diguanylate cyclase (GGDEF)-like protein
MVAPASTWLVGGLIVRAQASRRRSERLATIDPLTGVLNRRCFFELAGPVLWRSIRTGQQLALLLLDLDHFKSVNDTYGHATGDAVLKALAECCDPHLQQYDLIARLGGEEFVVLLSDVTDEQAQDRAEQLRLAIAALAIATDGAVRVRPTVSIGVVTSTSEPTTLDGLLEVADRAMYAAKHGGRDRTCFGPDCRPILRSEDLQNPDLRPSASAAPRRAPSQIRRPLLSSRRSALRLDAAGDDYAPYGFDSPMLARLSQSISRLGRRQTMVWFVGISLAASLACGSLTLLSWHATLSECAVLMALSLVIPSLVAPIPVWVIATLSLDAEAAQRSAEHLASTDPLTGLCNRRHFFGLAEQRFDATRRNGGSLAVLLFDIDHFKSINDNHGHAVGDEVLTRVAHISLNCLRENDTLARYGGEEFVALLPDTSIEAAASLAERLRTAVAQAAMTVPRGSPIHATLSIGASQITAQDTRVDALIERADKAMYRAKQTGRNRVCAQLAEPIALSPGPFSLCPSSEKQVKYHEYDDRADDRDQEAI